MLLMIGRRIMMKFFEYKDNKFNLFPSIRSKNIKAFIIISIIVLAITSLSNWLKLDEKDIWKIYNLLLQRFDLQKDLPDIKDNNKKLEADIEVEVDIAISAYEKWESSVPPRMTNKIILEDLKSSKFTDTQRLVVEGAIYYECPNDVMGIRGAWVDADPNCH